REPAACGAIQLGGLKWKQLPRHRGNRLPHQKRARIALRVGERGREEGEQRDCPLARSVGALGAQLRRDLPCRPRDCARYDQRGNDDQYFSAEWPRSPASFARPLRGTRSIRNARACTSPPSRFTSPVVARAVPPVASRSSTIRTRCPLFTASSCISSESLPYSRS